MFFAHYLATEGYIAAGSHHNRSEGWVLLWGGTGLFVFGFTMISQSAQFVCGLCLALASSVAMAQPSLLDHALNVVTPQGSGLQTTSFGQSLAAIGAPRSARGPVVFVGGYSSSPSNGGTQTVRLSLGPPPQGTASSLWALPPDISATTLATGPDVNGDGVADLVVGAPSATNSAGSQRAGRVFVVDGTNGALLMSAEGATSTEYFGTSVALADILGDSKPELIVGAPGGGPYQRGEVHIFNLANSQRANTFTDGTGGSREFGTRVATADFDDDGKAEIVVGAPGNFYTDGTLIGSGAVQVFRSDGTPLTQPYIGEIIPDTLYPGPNGDTTERAGANLVVVDDISGDGVPDLASGGDDLSLGFLTFISGSDGSPLSRCRVQNASAVAVTDAADFDRDGRKDIGILTRGTIPLFAIIRGGHSAGQTTPLYELADPSLWQVSSFASVPFGLSRIFIFGEPNFQSSQSGGRRGRVFTVMSPALPPPPATPSRVTCR